jgi:dTDP-4-dehydrorhamnose 3,5-epimerase
LIDGATQDRQSITSEWAPLVKLIEGVRIREVKNVPKSNGVLTEIYRTDWAVDEGIVQQVFQATIEPGGLSAWHAHQYATDRLFVSVGILKIVLYDGRENSPSHGCVNELRFGVQRPALVVVPPGIWHGVQNTGDTPSLLLNLVDRAYQYENPDHWRLPPDTPKIPYSFAAPRAADALR